MEVRQFRVFMSPDAGKRVEQTLLSGYIGQGKIVDEFEKQLVKWFNSNPHVLTVNSGTSALQLALHYIRGGSIDEKPVVFTTPLTCLATTAAIVNSGMQPYWIDVDPNTCNFDLDDLERQLKKVDPVAILAVHYAGYPVDLERLSKIARYIPVVEDCAHALGSYTPHGHVGTLYGNFGCFSFQAIKTLTTGDGGALVLPTESLYHKFKKLRWFGLDRNVPRHVQDVTEIGFKYHMNDIAATIGLANLEHLDENLRKQKNNVQFYRQHIPDMCLKYDLQLQTSGWMFPVKVGNAQEFDKAMRGRGIETGLGHHRNDLHICLKEYRRSLPGLEWTVRTTSCIPSGWWLTPEEKEYILDNINKGW